MTRNKRILFLSVTLFVCSCTSIRLKSRNELDIHLDVNSYETLSGNYLNSINDTIHSYSTLYGNFYNDTIYNQKDIVVGLTTIDKKTIKLNLVCNETVIDSLILKGNYRRGYFKTRRKWSTRFIAGPLLWIQGDNFKYLGLTVENKLVVLNSGSGGVMLLVAFPIFAAGSGQYYNEYERVP